MYIYICCVHVDIERERDGEWIPTGNKRDAVGSFQILCPPLPSARKIQVADATFHDFGLLVLSNYHV